MSSVKRSTSASTSADSYARTKRSAIRVSATDPTAGRDPRRSQLGPSVLEAAGGPGSASCSPRARWCPAGRRPRSHGSPAHLAGRGQPAVAGAGSALPPRRPATWTRSAHAGFRSERRPPGASPAPHPARRRPSPASGSSAGARVGTDRSTIGKRRRHPREHDSTGQRVATGSFRHRSSRPAPSSSAIPYRHHCDRELIADAETPTDPQRAPNPPVSSVELDHEDEALSLTVVVESCTWLCTSSLAVAPCSLTLSTASVAAALTEAAAS